MLNTKLSYFPSLKLEWIQAISDRVEAPSNVQIYSLYFYLLHTQLNNARACTSHTSTFVGIIGQSKRTKTFRNMYSLDVGSDIGSWNEIMGKKIQGHQACCGRLCYNLCTGKFHYHLDNGPPKLKNRNSLHYMAMG